MFSAVFGGFEWRVLKRAFFFFLKYSGSRSPNGPVESKFEIRFTLETNVSFRKRRVWRERRAEPGRPGPVRKNGRDWRSSRLEKTLTLIGRGEIFVWPIEL